MRMNTSLAARCRLPIAGLVAVLGCAPSAGAAGFALFEQGARGMGFAGAFTAQANDPSAIFHNAAGIAFLKGQQVYLGGTLVRPSASFTGADPFPGSAVTEEGDTGILKPPSAYFTRAFNDRLVWGVGLHVPYGLTSQWANPDTFTGRFLSQKAELRGFSLNPTVAYKLADRLAVGGGIDLRFSSVALERRVPVINPFTQTVVDAASVRLESNTDFALGFNVGFLAKLSEELAVGAHYRHKVKADYTGSAGFTALPTGNAQLDTRLALLLPAGSVPVTTGIEFPAFLTTGIAYTTDPWTFEVDVNWYGWSSFRRLSLQFEGRPDLDEDIVEEYEDSFQWRFGVERRLSDVWEVRGGYFYDQTPAPPASVSPLLPDADRHGFAVGGTWRRGNLRLDGGSWLVLSPARSTAGLNRDRYNGTYKSTAVTLGLSLGYTF
jgi:long-chain fatty acid transport protein